MSVCGEQPVVLSITWVIKNFPWNFLGQQLNWKCSFLVLEISFGDKRNSSGDLSLLLFVISFTSPSYMYLNIYNSLIHNSFIYMCVYVCLYLKRSLILAFSSNPLAHFILTFPSPFYNPTPTPTPQLIHSYLPLFQGRFPVLYSIPNLCGSA